MHNPWHDLPTGPAPPDILNAVIEIPRGSRNKYEFDEHAGVFRLDRVLSSAVYYNFEYGYIEGTIRRDDAPDPGLAFDPGQCW